MQCKLLVVGSFVLALGIRLVLGDYEDIVQPQPDEIENVPTLSPDEDYDLELEKHGNAIHRATSDPIEVPQPSKVSNCSQVNNTGIERDNTRDDRFKDTIKWDLTVNMPCGPETRCDFTHRHLVCLLDPGDPPICGCDVTDLRHSQWSQTLGKCLGNDSSPCTVNGQCASYNCTLGICYKSSDDFEFTSEVYLSKASITLQSENLFLTGINILWFAITCLILKL